MRSAAYGEVAKLCPAWCTASRAGGCRGPPRYLHWGPWHYLHWGPWHCLHWGPWHCHFVERSGRASSHERHHLSTITSTSPAAGGAAPEAITPACAPPQTVRSTKKPGDLITDADREAEVLFSAALVRSGWHSYDAPVSPVLGRPAEPPGVEHLDAGVVGGLWEVAHRLLGVQTQASLLEHLRDVVRVLPMRHPAGWFDREH